MKIVFLCKRHPQQRDLLTRPYGRFFHIPYFLAQSGLDVTIILVDYRGRETLQCEQHGITWHVVPLNKYWPFASTNTIEKIVCATSPDWIAGLSDTWYGILANTLGRRHGYKVLIDAYDNYESYIPWLTPLHFAWRHACQQADLLTAAGPQLLALMNRQRDPGRQSCVVPMAADPIFTIRDPQECRSILNLPEGKLVGYLGSLHPNRDPKQFFDIVEQIAARNLDIKFIVSGRRHPSISIPPNLSSYIVELGYLDDELMPIACNAMDLLLALGKPSAFGSYAYPVKIYEGLQCNKPVFVTRTPSTEWILQDHTELLLTWNQPESSATSLVNYTRKDYATLSNWKECADIIINAINTH